jgi:hypothetical protein
MGGLYKCFGVCFEAEFNCLTYTNMRTAIDQSVEGLGYLLTAWSRVLLEKLTDLQLVKKFPAFYGTRRFITTFTSARHLSLS